MSEEITPFAREQEQEELQQQPEQSVAQGFGKGDIATVLLGVGSILDSTLHPLSKLLSQALDSMTVVANQVLEGVNNSLGPKK
ncbi:MAG: hypothetical protein WCH05_00930 [Chlorobiaceae bacterium]